MASPRLPPPAAPATSQELSPEVADAWIKGHPRPSLAAYLVAGGERPQASTNVHERPETPTGVRRRSPKSIVRREDGREEYRLTVYLSIETTHALDAQLAAQGGGDTSKVIELAVLAWLRDRGR